VYVKFGDLAALRVRMQWGATD